MSTIKPNDFIEEVRKLKEETRGDKWNTIMHPYWYEKYEKYMKRPAFLRWLEWLWLRIWVFINESI